MVACDVEVCAARDLVDGNALSRFDVAQDACIWLGRQSGGNVSVANGGKTNKPRNYNVVSLFLVGRSKKNSVIARVGDSGGEPRFLKNTRMRLSIVDGKRRRMYKFYSDQ